MNTRLTPEEYKVIDKLSETWNNFIKLPKEHPDDQSEFRHALHTLQLLILARPERRDLAVNQDNESLLTYMKENKND